MGPLRAMVSLQVMQTVRLVLLSLGVLEGLWMDVMCLLPDLTFYICYPGF